MPLIKTDQEPKNKSKILLDKSLSLSFVNLSPLLTGFVRTIKSICNIKEENESENVAENQFSNVHRLINFK